MPEHSCLYRNIERQQGTKVLCSGCEPSRVWVPQMDMNYCPFCGGHLQLIRIVPGKALSPEPPLSKEPA